MKYQIKNWQNFQHYKDRAPPWIKLHNSLLTSEVWVMGNDATRTLCIACMLLASRNESLDGVFNGDPEYVKRYAYLNSKPDFKPLIDYGFIEVLQDDRAVLATCNTEERRGETEKSREETEKSEAFALPDWINKTHWDIWMKARKKMNSQQKTMQVEKLSKWRSEGLDFSGALANAAANGTQGLFLPNSTAKKYPAQDKFSEKDYGSGVMDL